MGLRYAKMFSAFFILSLFLAQIVSAAWSDNAVMAYRSATASGVNYPKIRDWNQAGGGGTGTWSAELELPTAGSPVRDFMIKFSPVTAGKRILVTQSDDGWLDSYVCSSNCALASSWKVANNIGKVWTTPPPSNERRFAIEFERATGDTLLVYSVENTDPAKDLAYRVMSAGSSTWGAESYINDVDTMVDLQYSWLNLDRDPVSTSQEIVLGPLRTQFIMI